MKEPLLKLSHVKTLLGVDHLPGNEEELRTLRIWTEELARNHGVKYVCRKREELVKQWKLILNQGLLYIEYPKTLH